jgi:thiol-disulfide isomerase/thioredoxin
MAKIKKPILTFSLLILMVLTGFSFYKLSQKQKIANAEFTTIKGEKISMQSLKGKVVLINFWATDCRNCVKEMPDLIKTYQEYQNQGLEIIAVAMPYDPPAQVVNYATQKQLPFPVMHDSYAEITQKFGGVKVTPTTYIYNKQGKRIQHAVGLINFNKLHALLDKELS